MAAVSTFFNSVKFGDTFGDRTVLADIFVTAVLSQMKKIKSEAGLVRYLTGCSVFQGMLCLFTVHNVLGIVAH